MERQAKRTTSFLRGVLAIVAMHVLTASTVSGSDTAPSLENERVPSAPTVAAASARTETESLPVQADFAADPDSQRLSAVFDRGFALAMVVVFLIGLALNLTPCVYPMLAVTVSIFSGGGNERRGSGHAFLKALVYVLGMATMYSALGVAAALTGGLFGGILQSPFVLLAIGLLFFALALSMFGLYELRVPARLAARLGGAQTAGWAGMFASGLLVGIFAAPCVGPPIIALLAVVGQRADPLFGFVVFFVLSMGLGLPYLVLGTFSGLISKLPRSGSWMVWVKKVFGIVLIAVACFYAALAVDPAWVFVAIPLVLGIGGVYLGFIEKSQSKGRAFAWTKRLAGLGFIVGSLVLARAGRQPSIEWTRYTPEALARAQGGPAVLYFTASWCLPCLELDRLTFTDKALMTEMRRFSRIKVDISRSDSGESEALRRQWRVKGPPTLIFLDARGNEIPGTRLVGFMDAAEMLAHLRTTLAAGGSAGLESEPVPADDEEDADPSDAVLVANVEWIQPGRPFKAGVLLRMDEHWHTYWINAGDSGTAAKIVWKWPEGFEVGAVRWPYPMRFMDEAYSTFGHENELLLSVVVTPPETLEPGAEVRVAADVEWLVCQDICIALRARPTLVLPVRAEAPAPSQAWSGVFDATERHLPVSAENWSFRARADGAGYVLSVAPSESWSLEDVVESLFFPSEPGFLKSGPYRWEMRAGEAVLALEREGKEPADGLLKGVLVLPEGKADELGVPRAVVVDASIER